MYYHSDHLGSSNILTDKDGNLAQHLEYTPYGLTATNEGPDPNATNYKFTGKELDSTTGLYYYGARYYDPELGRFIQADTIVPDAGNPQTLNRYSYVYNNPVKYTDPSGNLGFLAAIIIGAIIGAATGAISAYQAGGDVLKGALFGAVVGTITAAFTMGTVAYMNNLALGSGGVITAAENALITGVEFGIGGFGAGLVSGYGGGVGDTSSMFKSAFMGAGIGFLTGAAAGYSYQAGWQSALHGNDSLEINSLYKEAQLSLQSGNLTRYIDAANELIKMGIKPPSGVLAGYSSIVGNIDHTFLVAAKEGMIKAKGGGTHPIFTKAAALNKRVPGSVRAESANNLARANYRFLTSDMGKVKAVWENMDKVKLPIYHLIDPTRNCYGWRNAVLRRSGIAPPNDLPWIN